MGPPSVLARRMSASALRVLQVALVHVAAHPAPRVPYLALLHQRAEDCLRARQVQLGVARRYLAGVLLKVQVPGTLGLRARRAECLHADLDGLLAVGRIV